MKLNHEGAKNTKQGNGVLPQMNADKRGSFVENSVFYLLWIFFFGFMCFACGIRYGSDRLIETAENYIKEDGADVVAAILDEHSHVLYVSLGCFFAAGVMMFSLIMMPLGFWLYRRSRLELKSG